MRSCSQTRVCAVHTLGHYFWPIWPMLGWGIGLGAHGASVYMDGEGIRDRMIAEELEKLRKSRLS